MCVKFVLGFVVVLCVCKWKNRDYVFKRRFMFVCTYSKTKLSFEFVCVNKRYVLDLCGCKTSLDFVLCVYKPSLWFSFCGWKTQLFSICLCSILCYRKPQANFVTYKTKDYIKSCRYNVCKAPCRTSRWNMDRFWSYTPRTRFWLLCVDVGSDEPSCQHPTYNVLTRWVLKGHKSRVQIRLWHTLYWNFQSWYMVFICSYNWPSGRLWINNCKYFGFGLPTKI